MCPCFTKTPEVLGNPSPTGKRFSQSRGKSRGWTVRLWISQCLQSFAGVQTFSHHQSFPRVLKSILSSGVKINPSLLMTGEWYIPAVRQHWRLVSRGEGRVGGERGRPEIASFSPSHISSQFQLPLTYLPTIFQGPQGLKARRGGPPKGKGRTLLRQDTCSCPGPSTIIGIWQGFLTNQPKIGFCLFSPETEIYILVSQRQLGWMKMKQTKTCQL